MAVSKKTTPTKKTTRTTKTTKKVKARPLTWRFYVVTIGIFLVSVAAVVVLALFTAQAFIRHQEQARLDRINAIYASLNLDDSYILSDSMVFGDKRVYEWDDSRTYSSRKEYIKADTVSNTVAELDAKIKAAGFGFIDEPYPGTVSTQYHYKSPNGEYVRLTVASKPYWDATSNAALMNQSLDNFSSMDTNAGPSKVTIKVNLDDNNE
jgi:hypothetical protein